MKKLISLALIPVLASCTQYSEIETEPMPVNFTTATAKNNVHKNARTAIRTLFATKEGERTKTAEITGVPCRISGQGYRLSLTSPAYVDLPTYLGKTDPVTVSCTYQGKTIAKTVKAFNKTANEKATYAGPGGLAAVVVFAAVAGAIKASRDPSKDVYTYPDTIEVTFGAVEEKE